MTLRDKIDYLLENHCGEEEIVSALTLARHKPETIRKVLRELKKPVVVKPKAAAKEHGNTGGASMQAADRRDKIFHAANGKTLFEIYAECPEYSHASIDRELAEMLMAQASNPPLLKRDKDVVYWIKERPVAKKKRSHGKRVKTL